MTTRWNIDPVHTSAVFEVQHMQVSTYRSNFTRVSGTVMLDDEKPEASSIEARIDVKSIGIASGKLLEVMLGEQFFQADKHPELVFKSSTVEKTDATHWRAEGTLEMRGIARPFTLAIEELGRANHPFNKKPLRAFRASGELDRLDWGITWQAQLDTGAKYLGEKVTVSLQVELLTA